MADRYPALIAAILTCAALALSAGAKAQTEPLYRVELIVFSYPAGGGAEQWKATPELTYPSSSRFLTTPEDPAAAGTLPVAPSTAGAPGAEPPQPGPSQPAAFAILPSTQQELRDKAAVMQRSGRYHLLFHEAWLQPVADQARTLPIVLDHSGDGGQWPALQGTIKLYAARDLYLETNLWLNTQGEYLHSAWRMPPPPRGPASTRVDRPIQPEADVAPTLPSDATPAMAQAPTQQTPDMNPEAGQEYPFRHAVLLQGARRIHYGKVNYIDHPMLGIVVKVTPLAEVDAEPAASPSAEPGQNGA